MTESGRAILDDGVGCSLVDEVSHWRRRLTHLGRLVEAAADSDAGADDTVEGLDLDRLALIEALELLKSAAAAAQARLTVAFRSSQLAAAERVGTDPALARRSVAGQVALARHDSPVRGGRQVGLATTLVQEMPSTLAALTTGEVSEWRAVLVARETAWLSREHRSMVDAELSGRMGGWGDRRCANEARAIAYRLDPRGAVERLSRAANDRRVSIRPAPDTMTYLTALLPVAQGVATYAALQRHADALHAAGDTRGRGQLMADELVARVAHGGAITGSLPSDTDRHDAVGSGVTQEAADAVVTRLPRGTVVEIQLIMTDRALFGADDQPAILTGHGPVPAPIARQIIQRAAADRRDKPAVWVRRLYTDRAGRLVAMDSRRRTFPPAARRFLVTRDQTCRTPWCDAPIRHADHVEQASRGGPTSLANGQGACENCNYTHAAPGWTARSNAVGTVHLTTPAGRRHITDPPPLHPPQPFAVDLIFPGGNRPRLRYAA